MNCSKNIPRFSPSSGFNLDFVATRSPFLNIGRCVFLLVFGWVVSGGLTTNLNADDRTLGDIDGDGVATVLDIVRMNAHAEKKQELDEDGKVFADVDRDGVINDADRNLLIQEILQTRTPEKLPLATVRSTSPSNSEANVAVTRETILHFTMPLHESTTMNSTQFFAKFGDRRIQTRVELASDRRKATLFYLEPMPANAQITVTFDSAGVKDLLERPIDGDGDGQAGGLFQTTFSTLGITALPSTGVVGQVLASEKDANGKDIPIQGAIITVDGQEETLRAVTDANGNFTLNPAPGGSFFVHIDGRKARGSNFPDGDYYPFVGKKWFAEAGRADNPAGDIDDTAAGVGSGVVYLPLVKAGSLIPVSSSNTTLVTAPPEVPGMEGVKLEVPPNALFDDKGTRGGSVGIAPVQPDRLPSPLPEGLNLPLVITVQTDGPTNFDRPVPVTFPNAPDPETGEMLAPGEKSALWSFNHDTGEWEIVGPMTVTDDGKFVTSDAGVGLLQPGWHGTQPGAWGEGRVCHACSDLVGEKWKEASEGAYSLADGTQMLFSAAMEEEGSVLQDRIFKTIQFKGSNGAPAGLTAQQLDDLKGYLSTSDPGGWRSQLVKFSIALEIPQSINNSRVELMKLLGGAGNDSDALDWWSALSGLVEWNAVKDRPVALDLPIRMTLLSNAVLVKPLKNDWDSVDGLERQLRNKKNTLIAAIVACQKDNKRKKEAKDISDQNGAGLEDLLKSILKELDAWQELVDSTPDLEARPNEAGPPKPPVVSPELPSKQKIRKNAKDWLNYLEKLRALFVLLQTKDQTLAQELEDFIKLLDKYFTLLNPYAVDCEGTLDSDCSTCVKEKKRPFNELYVYLRNPDFDERFEVTNGFISRLLSASSPYLMKVYSVKDRKIGAVFFLSPPTGGSRQIPTVPMFSDRGLDTDGDCLSDEAEEIIGTDPTLLDSDGDGINDEAELLNGTDPLNGRPARTGIIGTVPVFDGVSAIDVDVEDASMAVALGNGGIGIYDVTSAIAPARVREYKVGGEVKSVAAGRDFAAGAAGSRGLAIVPLASSDEETEEATIVLLKSPVQAVTTDGTVAYAGLQDGSVVAVEMASGEEIARITTSNGPIEDMEFGGNRVFARGANAIQAIMLTEEGMELESTVSVSSMRGAGGRRFRINYGGDGLFSAETAGYDLVKLSTSSLTSTVGPRDGQFGWKQMVPTGSGLGLAVVSPNSTDDGPHNVSIYNFKTPFSGSNPEFITTFETPGLAAAAALYNGLAFVADSASGVQVVNYMAFDNLGVPPTIWLSSNFDLTLGKVDEGKRMRLSANVSDDVLVRNVEFYLNDELLATDGNFPFEITFVTPKLAERDSITIRARAFDTGGNSRDTEVIMLELVPDSVPPRIVRHHPPKDKLLAPISKAWVRFSEPMDLVPLQAALKVSSIGPDKLWATADDLEIPYTGSFNTDTYVHTVTFSEPLPPGIYRIDVTNVATDLAGNALSNPLTDLEFRIYSNADTDGDGIPDDWEIHLGYNPSNAYSRWQASGGNPADPNALKDGAYDFDGDDLTDAGEILMQTDLEDKDTDGDNIWDGYEDTDFDGLRDGQEVRFGTNPFNIDTDGDSLDDNSEIADGTDPKIANPMPLSLVSPPGSYKNAVGVGQ
jgi:hypothetical protein